MTGVFACKELGFKVNTAPTAQTAVMSAVKDVETMKPSLKGTVDTWSPYDQDGWQRALMTGKALEFTFTGKRNIGDAGNDFIFGTMLKTGTECNTTLEIDFPDGAKLSMPCVVELTSPFGGDSTKVSTLEWTAHSDGKPTYTPAATTTGS